MCNFARWIRAYGGCARKKTFPDSWLESGRKRKGNAIYSLDEKKLVKVNPNVATFTVSASVQQVFVDAFCNRKVTLKKVDFSRITRLANFNFLQRMSLQTKIVAPSGTVFTVETLLTCNHEGFWSVTQ